MVVKDIYQGNNYSNIVKIFQIWFALGQVHLDYFWGEHLHFLIGLSINVAGGDGFLINPYDSQVYEINMECWFCYTSSKDFEIMFSITPNGILISSTALPIYDQVIESWKVVTNASSVNMWCYDS